MSAQRESWGTRVGLILAVAGNAIGLGNFLRFPVQAAQNGGGAFMIPYFAAFILLGIPLMWLEWAVGRHGGRYGHGSTPGMFDVLWKNRLAKYLGAMGLWISMTIMIYYAYIESWTLGFSLFSALQFYFDETTFEGMRGFLQSYQGLAAGDHINSIVPAYGFMLVTLGLNFWVLGRGLSKGIERLAKIAMPALFLFAFVLVVRIFTLGTPDPAHPDWNVASGLAFIWNPDFSQLSNARVWLAAAGQIFFTLSVGMGTIQAYASYLGEKDDIALSGLTTSATNEFAEVVLGGSIAIPVAVAFFGLEQTQTIAAGGAFDLGFVSMPVIFTKIPGGPLFGTLWFLLLFFAGITSSVAMAQPVIAFLKDEFGLSHKRATAAVAAVTLACVQPVVLFLGKGFLDEMDYWAGTFGLVVFALIETILFMWVFGADKAWKEIHRGADIRIPVIFKFILKYVTPAYLLFILVMWTYQQAIPIFLMDGVPDQNKPYVWGARALLAGLMLSFFLLIGLAWRRRSKGL
ncbi:MAG: sodium-dependent transporter [Acidobacteria bacterium]|nr:sodium-dependent transporter [Acidobacteriota bacterium]